MRPDREPAVAFAARLIFDYVIAENERRGIGMDINLRNSIRVDARRVAEHLEEHGALA